MEHRIADHTDVERTVHDGDMANSQNHHPGLSPSEGANGALPYHQEKVQQRHARPGTKQVSFRLGQSSALGDGSSPEVDAHSAAEATHLG